MPEPLRMIQVDAPEGDSPWAAIPVHIAGIGSGGGSSERVTYQSEDGSDYSEVAYDQITVYQGSTHDQTHIRPGSITIRDNFESETITVRDWRRTMNFIRDFPGIPAEPGLYSFVVDGDGYATWEKND